MSNNRFAAALLALATTTAVGSTAVAAPPAGVPLQMKVVRSGLRLEVAFGSKGPGAPIIQANARPSYTPSNWVLDPVGNFFRIRNRNSNMCLIDNGVSVRKVILQNTCDFNQQQFVLWKFTPVAGTDTYQISSQNSGLALCIIGDLTFSAVPLVSDLATGVSCDQRIQLMRVP